MSFSTVRLSVLILLGAVVLLFPADGLRALGLGEARVDSYLGQPLDVTIRLLEAESEAIEALTVSSASPADFQRLGIPAEALALGLDVTLDRRVDPPAVRVQSRRPVNDPIVQILIDARWSKGRVLREYTLFLDPPTIDSPPPIRRAPTPDVRAEETVPADPAPARPAPRPAPVERETAPDPEARVRPGDRAVNVQRGDTLWSIAYNWRPDEQLSMNQVMQAIFERNRHAFMDENINRLRSGAELTMPEIGDVRGLDQTEAERLIRQHMQAWQQLAPARDVPVITDAGVPEAVVADAPTPIRTDEPEFEHRLDVVPPEEDEFADGPVVSDSEIRRVQGAVGAVDDEIMAEGLESEEFDERIAAIREALETRDAAGLAVAEEELAELEARLREVRLARAEAEPDEVDAYFEELERELVGDDQEREAVAGVFDDDPAADPAAEEVRDEPVASPVDESASMPVTPTSEGFSLWQWLAIGGAAFVLIAVAAWAWNRRRSSASGAAGGAGAGFDDAETRARKAIAAKPQSLAAHLGLLKVLADRDDQQGFSDALDVMYQHVDDEEDGYWQDALGLAMSHAPNHPLLTPHETAFDETDDLDRRADELMGMFDSDRDDKVDGDEDVAERRADELPDLDVDEDEQAPDERQAESTDAGDRTRELGEDLDLAELSDRLDDPSVAPGSDISLEGESEPSDFTEFDEDDEPWATELDTKLAGSDELELPEEPEAFEEAPEETPSASEALEDEPDLDMEFEFTSSAEPDEVAKDIEQPAPAADLPEDPDEAEIEPEPDQVELDDELSLGEAEFETTAAAESELEVTDDHDEPAETPALNDEDADVKLDLARAYISVDLTDSARAILEEVIGGASTAKQEEARELLDDL